MNLNNSANETKINGIVRNWNENTQLVYSEDRALPLKDNQMNVDYSIHHYVDFQKLMYWLITDSTHRITLFLAEGSKMDAAIHTMIHSFLNALRSYSADTYTEMMKVIGGGDVNDSLFEILKQRIDIRPLDEAETLAESETQTLKTAMNILLNEVLKPAEYPNVIAMSDEDLERLLHSDEVYKPTKPTTVELFDDSPEAVAGMRYVLQKWPNVEVCFTEVFSDNHLRLVSRVRSHIFENAVYNRDRIMLLDHEMPIAPQVLYEKCQGESAGVIASVSSLKDVDANITTHTGFQYKGLMGTEIQKVEEFVQFISGLLRDLEERPKLNPGYEATVIRKTVSEYTAPTKKYLFIPENMLPGDLKTVVGVVWKESAKFHPQHKLVTASSELQADTFDTIEKDIWTKELEGLNEYLAKKGTNVSTMLKETEFLFWDVEVANRWTNERLLTFFLGEDAQDSNIKLSRTVLSKEDSGYFYAKEEIISTARKVLEGLGCTKK